MAKYRIDWDTLRLMVRQRQEGRSGNEVADDIKGISRSTFHRFMRGGDLDLESLLYLMGWIGENSEKCICRPQRQLALWDRS